MNENNISYEFWIDQYGSDFDEIIDIAYRISKTEFNETLSQRFKKFEADPFSVSGLIKQFCKITMLFLAKKSDRTRTQEIIQEVVEFLTRIQNSNFTQHDANILAATVIFLCASDKEINKEISASADHFYGTQFDLKLVHPKILDVVCNWYPRLEKIRKSKLSSTLDMS